MTALTERPIAAFAMLLAGIAQRVICTFLGPKKINICACALQRYCQCAIATPLKVTWSLSNLSKTRSYSRQCSDEPKGSLCIQVSCHMSH